MVLYFAVILILTCEFCTCVPYRAVLYCFHGDITKINYNLLGVFFFFFFGYLILFNVQIKLNSSVHNCRICTTN